MGETHKDGAEIQATYPATEEHFTTALNAALEAGDLDHIMGTMEG